MRKKVKVEIIALALIIALILIPVTLSKFKSAAETTGNISLAEWSVSLNQTGVNDNLVVVPESQNDVYTINLRSVAQVDVKYSIIISNLPDGVEVSVDNGNFQSQVNNTITFTDIGTILYTDVDKTKSHLLTFKAGPGATPVDGQTVNINVLVQQIL